MKTLYSTLLVLTISLSGCLGQTDRLVGGPCDQCDLMFDGMPAQLQSTWVIPDDEPGERLTIDGTIFHPDGKTPAPGIILYFYHTDAKGLYSNPDKTGNRHGHLRGWVKTDENGNYSIHTIRPAPYPNAKDPAHIHLLIKEPGKSRYWIDECLFEDDPLLTPKVRSSVKNRGGNGIMMLSHTQGGWRGCRDITLGKNVNDY